MWASIGSYPVVHQLMCSSIEEDKYTEKPVIDNKRLHHLLLKGCHYPPTELETGEYRTAGNENNLD